MFLDPRDKPEEPVRSKGEVHIFNIYMIYSERFQIDRLKTLGQVHYTKHRQMCEILLGWGYVLRPPGAKPEEPGRSKGEVHIFNIYIIDSKRFQVDWLKTLGQVHYTKFCVRRTDGRTPDGRTPPRTQNFQLYQKSF